MQRSYYCYYFWKYGQILVDKYVISSMWSGAHCRSHQFFSFTAKSSVSVSSYNEREDSSLPFKCTFGKGGRWRETSLHLHGQIPGNTPKFFMVTHWRNFNFFHPRGLLPGNTTLPPDRLSASFCYLVPMPGSALKSQNIFFNGLEHFKRSQYAGWHKWNKLFSSSIATYCAHFHRFLM